MTSQLGRVLWITGLSGAGKTTVAHALVACLRDKAEPVVLLDGDALRQAVADPNAGHDRAGRLVNAWRMSRLAKLVADQGCIVVVATMSLFHAIHAWNRESLPGYLEVYLRVRMETLHARDPKGLYAPRPLGEFANLVGIDLAAEFPLAPDVVIDNDGAIDAAVERILAASFPAPASILGPA